jgi:hypothetical protein
MQRNKKGAQPTKTTRQIRTNNCRVTASTSVGKFILDDLGGLHPATHFPGSRGGTAKTAAANLERGARKEVTHSRTN